MVLPRYDINVITKKNNYKYKKILNMSKNSNNITEIDGRPMNIPKINEELSRKLDQSKNGMIIYANNSNENEEYLGKKYIYLSFFLFVVGVSFLFFGIDSRNNSPRDEKGNLILSKKELESLNYILISLTIISLSLWILLETNFLKNILRDIVIIIFVFSCLINFIFFMLVLYWWNIPK